MRVYGSRIIGKTLDMKEVNPVREFKVQRSKSAMTRTSEATGSLVGFRASRMLSSVIGGGGGGGGGGGVTFDEDRGDGGGNKDEKKGEEKGTRDSKNAVGRLKGCRPRRKEDVMR